MSSIKKTLETKGSLAASFLPIQKIPVRLLPFHSR